MMLSIQVTEADCLRGLRFIGEKSVSRIEHRQAHWSGTERFYDLLHEGCILSVKDDIPDDILPAIKVLEEKGWIVISEDIDLFITEKGVGVLLDQSH